METSITILNIFIFSMEIGVKYSAVSRSQLGQELGLPLNFLRQIPPSTILGVSVLELYIAYLQMLMASVTSLVCKIFCFFFRSFFLRIGSTYIIYRISVKYNCWFFINYMQDKKLIVCQKYFIVCCFFEPAVLQKFIIDPVFFLSMKCLLTCY